MKFCFITVIRFKFIHLKFYIYIYSFITKLVWKNLTYFFSIYFSLTLLLWINYQILKLYIRRWIKVLCSGKGTLEVILFTWLKILLWFFNLCWHTIWINSILFFLNIFSYITDMCANIIIICLQCIISIVCW